jgi:hypothetical protein
MTKKVILTLTAALGLTMSALNVHAESPYSTGYVTIQTIPEGAMILINTATNAYGKPCNFENGDFVSNFSYLAQGRTPITIRVPLVNGVINETLVVELTPTGPGQFSQRGHVSAYQRPGVSSNLPLVYRFQGGELATSATTGKSTLSISQDLTHTGQNSLDIRYQEIAYHTGKQFVAVREE